MPSGFEPIVVGNPSMFNINDISIGVINSDIIKDLVLSFVTKETKTPKIEVALRSILEQRTFYPLYPGNPRAPIELEQYKQLMFPGLQVPDILITPSDLMLFAKVSISVKTKVLIVICVLFRTSMDVFVSTQAC